MELTFEEPPPSAAGSQPGTSLTSQWLRELRKHKGKWAVFTETELSRSQARNRVAQIKKGLYAEVKPGEFEAKSRTVDGQTWLYAKYVGE